jgi:hypothetical protein
VQEGTLFDCNAQCIELLNSLTSGDLSNVTRFAGFRLSRVGLHPGDGQDVVQDALHAVLLGIESPATDRHPRPMDLASGPAFLCYLKGVISSLVSFELRRRRNPIPIVLSMNYLTGQIVKDVIQTKDIGMVLQFGAVVRGATTTFEAEIDIDYDRTYELLATHVSWNWWIWSGDVQAAWQTLTTTGAIKVKILGGTADQKTMIYKMMEFMRDLFFKPELSTVTTPNHPTGGIINTSLRYEKTNEHKHFHFTLNESDFTEAPFNSACMTGKQDLGARTLPQDPMIEQLFRMAAAQGFRVQGEAFPKLLLDEIQRFTRLLS